MPTMNQFTSPDVIPPSCVAASAYFAPRPGVKPVGEFEGHQFYDRGDVSALFSADEWRLRGKTIKPGEKPIAQQGDSPVFGDWQAE